MKSQQISFLPRIFACLVLIPVLFGVGGVAARAMGQQTSPAPVGTQPQTPAEHAHSGPGLQSEIAPGQVKKEEAEDDNVYRHTALVGSMARLFHLDIETTARLFEYINFAIIALAIVIPLARFVPRVLRKRRETLSQDLESARKASADANARLSAVEAQLAKFDEEIARFRAQVEEDSKHDEQRIKATIEEESARIVAAAEQEIGVAAAQARRGLRHFAADLAIEQATRQLVLTPETDRALISEFVGEAAKNGGGNGAGKAGQN